MIIGVYTTSSFIKNIEIITILSPTYTWLTLFSSTRKLWIKKSKKTLQNKQPHVGAEGKVLCINDSWRGSKKKNGESKFLLLVLLLKIREESGKLRGTKGNKSSENWEALTTLILEREEKKSQSSRKNLQIAQYYFQLSSNKFW